MYHYIVENGSTLRVKFLRDFLKFSHLLIGGMIKGLSPNYGILSLSYGTVHNGSRTLVKFLESNLRFLHLLITGLN